MVNRLSCPISCTYLLPDRLTPSTRPRSQSTPPSLPLLRDPAIVPAPSLPRTTHLHRVRSNPHPLGLFLSRTAREDSTQTTGPMPLLRPSAACKVREGLPLSVLPVSLRPVPDVQGTYPRIFRYPPHQEGDQQVRPAVGGQARTKTLPLTETPESQLMHCHPISSRTMGKVTFDWTRMAL